MDPKEIETLGKIYEAVTSYAMPAHFYIPAFSALVAVIGVLWAHVIKTSIEHKERETALVKEVAEVHKTCTGALIASTESDGKIITALATLESAINNKIGG